MVNSLKFATCQFPVSGKMEANIQYILKYMNQAAEVKAKVIHFPEVALTGYARVDFASFSDFNWDVLNACTERIIKEAKRLKIWVILGSCRQTTNDKPRNCTHVISNSGSIVSTYDKQNLYSKESLYYSPGDSFTTFSINGIKCGLLICYDSSFPELYDFYRKEGVKLLFHSYYNASNKGTKTSLDDLALAQLRTRAADNQMHISASNSSARHSRLASCIARPDGSIVSTKRHVSGIVIHSLPDTTLGWTYDNSKRNLTS